MKKYASLLTAVMIMAAPMSAPFASVSAETEEKMNINIDLSAEKKAISPYIYGVNQYGNDLSKVSATSIRQGGNRMTAYNWENNASNAGSDWKHSSDNNLSNSDEPADCAMQLSKEAERNGASYKFTTLQLAGYVAADKNGTVTEAEAAPSDRWNEVVLSKGSTFDESPDLTDGKVYMDEYVNYIINKLGDSSSPTGIQGYSLDNEPALWHHTHSRIHPERVTIDELAEKSIEMAAAVKKLDPEADIFGPALFGYSAFCSLADDDSSDEWEKIKAENNYHWYLDCYLEQMKKAEEEHGIRLLDVLDIHYYPEAKGQCRVSECTNPTHTKCAEARMQSVRTLYEEGYIEDSWIGQWGKENLPMLPTIQESIDKYYPGTKLAITEYNFGGEDLSATIAQAEALGCFADAGVYLATKWSSNDYQFAGINLYTNYDGNGSSFGDMLVPTKTDDVSLSSAYASIKGDDQGTVTAMITNKNLTNTENAVINLKNANTSYEAAAVYAVYGDSAEIRLIDIIDDVKNNVVNVELPAYSAAMVVITDDASDFDGLELYDPDAIRIEKIIFDDLEDRVNANGYVEVPVEDPEHLKQVIINGNVTSEMGASWGTAGCAVSINAKDKDGTDFWTYKSFSLSLGSNSSATVEFDGTFKNEEEVVEGVIADGKIEFQKWWDSSEKSEEGDVIGLELTSIQLVYEYENNKTPDTVYGDANCDGNVNLSDAILVMQTIGNPDSYGVNGTDPSHITEQGVTNADVANTGDNLTNADALAIQEYLLKLISVLPKK
ncbi:MAG: glycoside hydrolase [Ruminococcus sp.]|nr:glycoside hydrolase [Ruminococcus sp.]